MGYECYKPNRNDMGKKLLISALAAILACAATVSCTENEDGRMPPTKELLTGQTYWVNSDNGTTLANRYIVWHFDAVGAWRCDYAVGAESFKQALANNTVYYTAYRIDGYNIYLTGAGGTTSVKAYCMPLGSNLYLFINEAKYSTPAMTGLDMHMVGIK